ncbi:hypothetical protein AN477_17915 [Alicyclobacillus ferrooxydans]|uniref:YigZ family protein n=2 Tax=Alicyclobacillus ferrooxydans TaxID=471514 RepID=A0A0P9CAP7_9BACL|nr:hypothetical protein AN477_17915 [Alicyclobacillus ferrooxydans]
MSEEKVFYTIEETVETESVIKKSRFISRIVPIQSAEEAEEELAKIREVHKGANHNCFAYRFGLGVPVERFSDDGEPSGTAGRPILDVMRRRPILNALVVVTRYFGGMLLGANGLIRAYADGASSVIDAATVLKCTPMQRITLRCDYSLYGKLEYVLQEAGYALEDKTYAEDVSFAIWVNEDETSEMLTKIADVTGGQARSDVSHPTYVGVRPDGSLLYSVLHQK